MSTNSSNLYNTTGILLPKDACVVIVRTEWNADTIEKLVLGCTKLLQENNIPFKILTVHGAFEIAFCIKNYWDKFKYREDKPHAFIALGCVVKGDTPHFDFVCKAESLETDFKKVKEYLNCDISLPCISGYDHWEFKKYLNDRSIQLIKKVHERDVDFFKYSI